MEPCEGQQQQALSRVASAAKQNTMYAALTSFLKGELSFLNLLCKLNTAKRRLVERYSKKKSLAGMQEGARSEMVFESECRSKYSEKTAFLFLHARIKLLR